MAEIPKEVRDFLEAIENKTRRTDSETLIDLYFRATGHPPVLWGNMIGFDAYDYRYESGHEGRSFLAGFSPRKANLVVYLTSGTEHYPELLSKLGKHKSAVSCVYINKLADVDLEVLEKVITLSYKDMKSRDHFAC
ncbi:MAG: DUF1801 domain-containing protein [Paracoccaceae bacterium]